MIASLLPVSPFRLSAPVVGNQRARKLMTSAIGQGEEYLQNFVNFERSGVPDGAGRDNKDGFDMGRMYRLLDSFGNPQSAWPAVHVAGTKGKGSTTAMLASILRASDYKVGTYTSPHVTTLRERIAINRSAIAEDEFNALVQRQMTALESAQQLEGGVISHFEAMVALAYKQFQEQLVDVAVVEAGLGGTRDATNVFTPAGLKLAMVTAIGLEHQKALGDTLTDIAAAKAGILKQGRPAVIARQPEAEALRELERAASEKGCPVVHPERIVSLQAHDISYDGGIIRQKVLMKIGNELPGLPVESQEIELQLLGDHQLDNAAAAIAAALSLRQDGFDRIGINQIAAGLSTATLPGRFQVAQLPPYSEHVPPWIVLDGAHTPASAAALAKTVRQVFPSQPLAFVVAMADDKDHGGFLSGLVAASPMAVVFTRVPIVGSQIRSVAPGKLAAHWQALGMQQKRPQRCRELIQASLSAAVEAAKREVSAAAKDGPGVVCVCGSLHAVSEGLQLIQND